MFFFTFLFLIISVFSNYLINTTAQSPESYSFALSTCGNDTFITVEISDNKCEFANEIYNPKALSCKLDNNNQWKITLAGCDTHCTYSWNFNVNNLPQQKIDATYTCSGEPSHHHDDAHVEYLTKPPSTYFLSLASIILNKWLPFNILAAPNRCFITTLIPGSAECHCNVSNCSVTFYIADNGGSELQFNIKLDDKDPGIPDHIGGVPLSYSTQTPNIYNFRHERPCGTLSVTIFVTDKICSVMSLESADCECQNGQCSVNIEGCEASCKNTWTFDLNNPIDTDITYTCKDGRNGTDNDPHVHHLNFSKDESVFYPSEMVALCFLGVNIETGQIMVPITNISVCIDSYNLNRDITYSPFSEQIFIGDNKVSYVCQEISSAVTELCISFLHHISNVNNVYNGYSEAITTIGGTFIGMINDLTVNPARLAFDNKINHLNLLQIASDVLGLPGGGGTGIANNVFKTGTYIGVFPVINLGMDIIASFFNDGPPPPPSDLVSPISYDDLANAFTTMETKFKDILSNSLKTLDEINLANKYGLTKSLDNSIRFNDTENDINALRDGFIPLLTARTVSLILKFNGVKICSNKSGGLNADGHCGFPGDGRCSSDYNNYYNRCGTVITKFGPHVLGNASYNSNHQLYIDTSNLVCLMANFNFKCDQFQRINYNNINVFDACTQANGWNLPINQTCTSYDFDCNWRNDFDLCWGVVSGSFTPRKPRNERAVNPNVIKKKNG